MKFGAFQAVESTASEGGLKLGVSGEGCPRQNPVRLAQPAPRLLAQIQHRESCGDWLPGTGIPRPSTRLQVLKGELVIAAKRGQESEQVKQHGDHRIEIFSGSEPTDQALGYRTDFWRGTGLRVVGYAPWRRQRPHPWMSLSTYR
jgi:hypothetical protein